MGTEWPGWILNWLSGRISLNFTQNLRAWDVLLFKTYFWTARSVSARTWYILCLTKKDSYNFSSFKSLLLHHAAQLNVLRCAPCLTEKEQRAGWKKSSTNNMLHCWPYAVWVCRATISPARKISLFGFWLRTLTSVVKHSSLVYIHHKPRHLKKMRWLIFFPLTAGRL